MSPVPPEKSKKLLDETFFTPLATVHERLAREGRSLEGLDARAVQRALGLRSLHLTRRLLAALAGPGRAFHTSEEFLAVAQRLMAAPVPEKVAFLFALADEDGDGRISPEELDRLLHISLAENNLELPPEEAETITQAVIAAGDRDGDGHIGRAEFERLVEDHPALGRRLADYGVSLLMPGKRARNMTLIPGSGWGGSLRNRAVVVAWFLLYLALNALLFAQAFLRFRTAGANLFVQVAHGCGAALNLNGALIVVPMLRRTFTWIRRSSLGRVVPVDDTVSIHRLVGEAIVVLSVVHTAAHLLNMRAAGALSSFAVVLAWNRTLVTGAVLLLVLAVMWLFSRNFVRRSRRFELFHATHLAYFAWLPLLFVHGPVFWMWGTFPVLGYVVERFKLSVHIRSVGNWTSALRERVTRSSGGGTGTPGGAGAMGGVVHIDGPYGTPSRHILEVTHAVAIAGGIGVTPFAAILQSLLLRQRDPDPDAAGSGPRTRLRLRTRTRLRKLHFVWLNRDQQAFRWFSPLLANLERLDKTGLLDIHVYFTAGRADMGGGIIDLAQHVLRARKMGDIVTGLKAHTVMGPPDFDRLLESFYANPQLPRPRVFFCGPAPLGSVVAKSCRRLRLRFRREHF